MFWVVADAYHKRVFSEGVLAVSVTGPLPQREPGVTVGLFGLEEKTTECEAVAWQLFKVAVTV